MLGKPKAKPKQRSFEEDLLTIKRSVQSAKRDRERLASAPVRQRKILMWVTFLTLLALAALTWDGFKEVAQEKIVQIVALLEPAALLPTGSRQWTQARVSEIVKTGDEIRTGDGGGAHLSFPDDTVIKIGANALFYVRYSGYERASGSRKREFDLVGGRIWCRVSKLVGGDSYFRVNTPCAVAAVRGTRFSVIVYRNTGNPALPDGTTFISVEDGNVQVIAKGVAQRSIVTSGQQAAVIPGLNQPAQPVPMAPQEQRVWQAQKADPLSRATNGAADVLSDPPSGITDRIRHGITWVQEQIVVRPLATIGGAMNITALSGPKSDEEDSAPARSADQGAYAKAMVAARALQMAIEHSYDPTDGYPAHVGLTDLSGLNASRDEVQKILGNVQDGRLQEYKRTNSKYQAYIRAKQPSDKLILITPDGVQALGDVTSK